jgi:hypothetical protein
MKEIMIVTAEDLKIVVKQLIEEFKSDKHLTNNEESEELNQKEAAKFLKITEATLIRWKKKKRVPYEQLEGSSKIIFYKSQLERIRQQNFNLINGNKK